MLVHRLLFTATLLLTGAVASAASTADWSWRFNGAYYGTRAVSSDGLDDNDQRITQTSPWYCGTHHVQGAGNWSGDTGFYWTDMRAPLPLTPGSSESWTFFLWEDPAYNLILELSWGWSRETAPAFDKMLYTLTYVRAAEGVTGGTIPVGTSVSLNSRQQGTWSFPVYKTADGLTGYMFTLTATVVPEPASIFGLLAGLSGFGFALRRRR